MYGTTLYPLTCRSLLLMARDQQHYNATNTNTININQSKCFIVHQSEYVITHQSDVREHTTWPWQHPDERSSWICVGVAMYGFVIYVCGLFVLCLLSEGCSMAEMWIHVPRSAQSTTRSSSYYNHHWLRLNVKGSIFQYFGIPRDSPRSKFRI